MSQAPDRRRETKSRNTPQPSRSRGVRRRVLRRLLLGLGLLCAAASNAPAQQAQIVKSAEPVICGGKAHELRLMTAEATVNSATARMLGIVLTPQGASESKMFGLYWMDAQSPSPTHRDDTSGNLSGALKAYGKGVTGKDNVPVVRDFFAKANCPSGPTENKQLEHLQSLLEVIGSAPALRDIVGQLKSWGIDLDQTQIKAASAENLRLFNDLQNDLKFAEAGRQYASNEIAAAKQTVGNVNLPAEAWTALLTLLAKNVNLEIELNLLRVEKDVLLGGVFGWLLIPLSIITLTSLALVVFKSRGAFATNGAGSGTALQATGRPAALIGKGLEELVNTACEERQRLEAKYSGTSQPAHARNQRAHTRDAATSQLSQQAAAWRRAYTELQRRLEELQGNATENAGHADALSSPPKIEEEPELSMRQIAGTLGRLVTDMGEMKSSVDGFNVKLAESSEASRGLQNIWWRWYGKEYSGGQTDRFFTEMVDVIALYQQLGQRCAAPGAAVAQIKRNLLIAIEDLEHIRKNHLANSPSETVRLHDLAAQLKLKMSQDAEAIRECETIKVSLRRDFRGMKASDAVTLLLNERAAAGLKLGKHHPGLDFSKTVDAVIDNYGALTETVKRALPGHSGSVSELVTCLATEYKALKPLAETAQRLESERDDLQQQLRTAHEQLAAGKGLAEEIASQLCFRTDYLKEDRQAITDILNRLKKEWETSVYTQLRLGLISAQIALEKATGTDGSEEWTKVIEALYLDRVKKGIQTLLAGMEECSREQLWDKGLSEGFSQKWLHYLIRADLLLRTYYADRKEFGLLRQVVSQACSGIQAVLYEFQVEVVEVNLFDELPGEMEREPVYAGIRNLSTVRDKVGLKIMDTQAAEVVVDVTSFPYFVNGVQANRGRASVANPSAWAQR